MMETLGKYTIVEALPSFGSNLIYIARDSETQAEVVLKVIRDIHDHPFAALSLEQEFNILARLQGSYFPKAYELVKNIHQIYMVMSWFKGFSIHQFLQKRNQALAIEQILDLAMKIIQAIDQIHNSLIIHKDISPYNVLVSDDLQEINIIDFGISTSLTREHPKIGNLSQLEGHLDYIAPEQTGRMNRSLDYRQPLNK